MIAKEEEVDAEVTREDQSMINTFGRLNNHKSEFEARRAQLQQQKRDLEDAANELLLLDDSDKVKFLVGEAYVDLSKDEAEARLKELTDKLDEELDAISARLDATHKVMSECKVALKAKFKDTITLDE